MGHTVWVSRLIVVLALLVAGCSAGVEVATTTPTSAPTTTSTTSEPAEASTTSTITPPITVASTTTTTVPPFDPIVLIFGGDVSLTHGLSGFDPFEEIEPLFSPADLAWVNLETAIAEEGIGIPVDKKYVFRSPPVTADLLAGAGVTGVALANNHTLDVGVAGLERTIELLDASGVVHAGAGPNRDEAYAPAVHQVGETSIAVVSFSRVLFDSSWTASENGPGLASAYHPFVERSNAAVEDAARLADVVVVMVHWGIERNACPEPYQRELATGWADAGADLVVGSHPHVLQGVELIGDTWVIYSTGNLAFPSARSDDGTQTALFEVTVDEDELRLAVRPLRIIGGRPTRASDADREIILETLNSRSWSASFDSDGRAMAGVGDSACG